MSRFFAGFAAATGLWAAVMAGLWLGGVIGPRVEPPLAAAPEQVAAEMPADTSEPRGRRGRRGRRAGGGASGFTGGESGSGRVPTGSATTGDDLGEGEARSLDMSAGGGEGQLTDRQVEDAFTSGMGRIRRCLVLAAGDDPVRGRLVFGMRIRRTGEVAAVNLSGPAVVTTGDAGDCLRSAARSIRFASFDGPDMVLRYPITLD